MPPPSRYHGGTEYKDLTAEEWEQFWKSEKHFFHKDCVNEKLLQHQDLLLAGREKCRVFLPLCGKSLDMKWFLDQGHTVVGVEFAQAPIRDFFKEHTISYTTHPLQGTDNVILYKADEANLRIYQCDVFNFKAVMEDKFDIIWDRGALGAINTSDRKQYSELILSLLAPKARMLISTFDYSSDEFVGPPNNVPAEQVQSLYGSVMKVEIVDVTDQLTEEKRNLGINRFVQNVHFVH